MFDVRVLTDLVAWGADFYRHCVPREWVPYPNLTAVGIAIVGILLAFWGARLLRTIYILAFMVAGAAEGFRIGSNLGIDTLIGLTFGAGIAALIGYLFYRWWVGVTTGAVAVLIVLAVAWPKIQRVEQDYRDYSSGLGTSDYRLPAVGETESPAQYVVGLGTYVWGQRKDFAGRLLFAAGLAWLLGMVLGLMLPKLTAIVGTSLLGVALTAVGVGVLLWRNCPEVWSAVAVHADWYVVGMAALLIVSLWRQGRRMRVRVVAPPPPPSEAPPAPTKNAAAARPS